MVVFDFWPKFLGGGRGLQRILCHYMNAGYVMGTQKVVGTVPTIIKFV